MKILHLALLNLFLSPQAAARDYNLTACKSTFNIIDRVGRIVKGIRELNEIDTYDKVTAHCNQYGMDLFLAEDQFIHYSFMQYANQNFGFHPCGMQWQSNCGFFLNGRRHSNNGFWYATINGRQKIMDISLYQWIQGDVSGNCMILKHEIFFGETACDCNMKFGAICEFNNTYQAQV